MGRKATEISSWPAPPPDLQLATIQVDGEELAVLAFRLEAPAAPFDALTPAEREVAVAALEGLSNREIGVRRGVSVGTVTKHLASAFRKLGIGSRRQLRALALAPRVPLGAGGCSGGRVR